MTLTFKEFSKKYPPNPKFEMLQAKIRTALYPNFDKVSKKQYDAIFDYTKNSSKLNSGLWGMKYSKEVNKDLVKDAKFLTSTLKELPTQHDKLVVYSGVRRPSNPQLWIEDSNGIVNIPSFLSTSLSPRLASQYVDYDNDNIGDLLIITIRPNQNIGGYIEDFSKAPNEQEFLIKCNFMLKIIDKEPNIYNIKFDTKKVKLRTWNAIVLNESEIPKDNVEADFYYYMKKILRG